VKCGSEARYTEEVTYPDFGPERPGPASSTRQLAERAQTEEPDVSPSDKRWFWIGFVAVLAAIALFAAVLRCT
jgi:hypothetical protein